MDKQTNTDGEMNTFIVQNPDKIRQSMRDMAGDIVIMEIMRDQLQKRLKLFEILAQYYFDRMMRLKDQILLSGGDVVENEKTGEIRRISYDPK